jgi:hypothetical protein
MGRLVIVATSLLAVTLLAAVTAPAWATQFDAQLDQGLFGHVNQNNVPAQGPGVPGSNSCGPTAVANSFQYLQNNFSTVYGPNTIIPAGMTAQDVAINLANNWMNTSNSIGTSAENLIAGKRNYLESVAPGKTSYAGQDPFYSGSNSFVAHQTPTFSFLYNALTSGADVEFGIRFPGGGGHFLTLTSLHWNDANNDGVIQSSENATIDYIDPETGASGVSSLFQSSPGGPLLTDYGGGAGIAVDVSELPTTSGHSVAAPASVADAFGTGFPGPLAPQDCWYDAVAVPEPPSLSLIGCALVGLAACRLRRVSGPAC